METEREAGAAGAVASAAAIQGGAVSHNDANMYCCNPYCEDSLQAKRTKELEKWMRYNRGNKPVVRWQQVQAEWKTSAGIWVNHFACFRMKEKTDDLRKEKFKVTCDHRLCGPCYNSWDRYGKSRGPNSVSVMSVLVSDGRLKRFTTTTTTCRLFSDEELCRILFNEAGVALADELFNGPYPSAMRTSDTVTDRYIQIANIMFDDYKWAITKRPCDRTFRNNFDRVKKMLEEVGLKFVVTGVVAREEERDGRRKDDTFIMPTVGPQQSASTISASILNDLHNSNAKMEKQLMAQGIQIKQLEEALRLALLEKSKLEEELNSVVIYKKVGRRIAADLRVSGCVSCMFCCHWRAVVIY
jgi:hypothetical protein